MCRHLDKWPRGCCCVPPKHGSVCSSCLDFLSRHDKRVFSDHASFWLHECSIFQSLFEMSFLQATRSDELSRSNLLYPRGFQANMDFFIGLLSLFRIHFSVRKWKCTGRTKRGFPEMQAGEYTVWHLPQGRQGAVFTFWL